MVILILRKEKTGMRKFLSAEEIMLRRSKMDKVTIRSQVAEVTAYGKLIEIDREGSEMTVRFKIEVEEDE